MLSISFDFDPATRQVSNMTVNDTLAPAKKAKVKSNTLTDITLEGSVLRLTDESMDLLGVAVGSRVCIRFTPHDELMICTPEAISEPNGGNMISARFGISCKGSVFKRVAALGTTFTCLLGKPGILTLTPVTRMDRSEEVGKQLVQALTEVQQDNSKNKIPTITDEDFTLALSGEGIDFDEF